MIHIIGIEDIIITIGINDKYTMLGIIIVGWEIIWSRKVDSKKICLY